MQAAEIRTMPSLAAISYFSRMASQSVAPKSSFAGAIPSSSRPAGFRPGDACPELLNEQEAIRYLRLDEIKIKNPGETLRYYRNEGLLRGTQISKVVFYTRKELDSFIEKVTQENPR